MNRKSSIFILLFLFTAEPKFMEVITKITCPACSHSFNAEQVLAQDIEKKVRLELNQQAKDFKTKLIKEAEEKEEQLKKQLLLEKQKIEEQLKSKVKEDFEAQLKTLTEENEQARKQNKELKQKEFEFMKKEKELKDKQEELELELQKKLLQRTAEVEAAVKKKAEEENQMKMKEKDMQLQAMKDQIEILKRKAEQGSMQLQGEVQEVILEELLKVLFPFDTIEEVGKGVRGADVIHTVKDNFGKDCGKIIYESKRTKAFSDGWIDKLKNDLRSQGADLAVIVTET